ncbi:MAG TPA: ATP-binding protein, partial [Solimonas sp.]
SAVHAALRARRRQYQIRRNLLDLAESEERLRLNDQRKDEFLAILAHELRNPLAPISNALHILRPWLAAEPQTASLGQMMERQVGNLTRLVDDLLEVSRVTRGELDLHCERIELAAIIRTAVESSQPLIDSLGHRLDTKLPPQPIYLHADPVRVAQIVSNLLNNAAKYTPGGGHIVLAVRAEGGQIAIEVQDNGIGIPREAQARIFELFMQIDQNRNRSQGGLGIGLTLVKRLAELHGGSIEMFSDGHGKGSRFTVRLPAVEPRNAERVAASGGGDPDLAHVHALIVDDNRDAADSLGLLLRHLGATVAVTYGGVQALEALDTRRMNVAILDIGMPDVDGLQVARQIRASAGQQKMLLIALTGWGQQQDIADTRAAGIDLHLTKPVDFDVLLTWLSRAPPRRGA